MRHQAAILALAVAFSTAAAHNNIPRETTTVPREAADTLHALPEVSVTALKGGAALRSRPVAATVVDQAVIERQGIVNMHSLSELAPNVYIPQYGSRITSSIYVRGLGARIDQPAVGLTIDNIPVLNKDNYDMDIDNLSRIEMLRGPHGAMYGRNTMAGVIALTTLSPSQYNGVKASVTGGSHGMYRAGAGVYMNVGGNVGLSAGGAVSGHDGYYRNRATGRMTGLERLHSGWYKLQWRPSQYLTVVNTGRGGRTRQNGYPYASLETGTIAYNDTTLYRRISFLEGLSLHWRRGPWQWSAVTSVQHIDDNLRLDQDFTVHDYFTLQQRRRETSVTQEIMVKHLGERIDWTAGAFAFTRHSTMRAPVRFLPYGIEQLIVKHRNDANPQYPVKWDDDTFVLSSDFSLPDKGAALYGSATWRTGRWSITQALRLEAESPSLRYHNYTSTAYTIYDATVTPPVLYDNRTVDIDERGTLHKTSLELLPALSVLYSLEPSGNVRGNVYATLSQGFKAGGYNTQMFSDFLQQKLMASMGLTEKYDIDAMTSYKPERCTNLEAGVHLDVPSASLAVDATAFYIDCRNQQLTRFPDGTTTGRIMDNAGRARSLGTELSASWQPVGALRLNCSWGFTDARFVHYDDGLTNYSGHRIPYSPAHTLYLSACYTRNTAGAWIDNFTAECSMRGVGSIAWNETGDRRQPFYATLRASVSVTKGCATLRLWGENLTDTRYNTFYFKSIGHEFVQRGAPVSLGATLSVDIDTAR